MNLSSFKFSNKHEPIKIYRSLKLAFIKMIKCKLSIKEVKLINYIFRLENKKFLVIKLMKEKIPKYFLGPFN